MKLLKFLGLDLGQLASLRYLPRYFRQLKRFKGAKLKPQLNDFNLPAGDLGFYFYQNLWAVRKIYRDTPKNHLDVGSSTDFLGALLAFIDFTFVDIRPLEPVKGLTHLQVDARVLPFEDESFDSISSLHVVEHIGLGRYGDPLDPEGHIKALGEMKRVLKPKGKMYISVPTGEEVVEFNNQRVFDPETIPKILGMNETSRGEYRGNTFYEFTK